MAQDGSGGDKGPWFLLKKQANERYRHPLQAAGHSFGWSGCSPWPPGSGLGSGSCALTCCPSGTDPAPPGPVTEISLRELQRMGLGDLDEADLNGDGMLDIVDVELYHQGYIPKPPKAVRLHGRP